MMDLRNDLLRTFFAESDELIDAFERATLALADGDDELLAEIYRHLHTLKGNASCLGFAALMQAAHLLEDAIAVAIKGRLAGDAALTALLLDGADALAT